MPSITLPPVSIDDPINKQILAVSEDRLEGFWDDPFSEISRRVGFELSMVLERIQSMLQAGTIRRVRQTLMSANLAPGALIAWQVPAEKQDAAFDYMFQKDPFSGHVVFRTTDTISAGSNYRLWTTLKVPQPFSMKKHCDFLCRQTGAAAYRLMPARCMFTLGVGHMRRRTIEPGSKIDEPSQIISTSVVELTDLDWQVLMTLKREFHPREIRLNPWASRAKEAGVSLDVFLQVARSLNERGVIGRFSTFLEHVKPLSDGQRVTKFNALFHWAVPQGREVETGREVGRHHVLTHAYWREGGPEFHNVNVMAVAHGTDKALLLKHKTAIDQHLQSIGIPVSYTNVFWGGRSEIKPSEVSPIAYREWSQQVGLDPDDLKS
jgi:DNA-binding Lrp family transcriptional regulator